MRVAAALLVALTVSAVTVSAAATPRMTVAHVQGQEAPWLVGWNEAVVSLDNVDLPAWRGEVLVDPSYDRKGGDRPAVRIPVSLAAGEGSRLVLPFYLAAGTYPTVVLVTSGEGEAQSVALGLTRPVESVATVVEIQGATARGGKLLELPSGGVATEEEEKPPPLIVPPKPHWGPKHPIKPLPTTPATPVAPTYGPATPTVSTVQLAKETGDPVLPDLAAGWSGAVVVVAPSDILSRLQGRQLDALSHWVVGGGTLAVWVSREEDLRGPVLKQLLAGETRMTSSSGQPATFAGGALERGSVTKAGDDGDVASYGLGKVWLLRRDPWARPPEERAAKTLYALWSTARDHRNAVMSLPAGVGVRWYDDDRVRKVLDPNHGFRPALGIAAILVVLYAFLVGPVAFARARKLGRPITVLKWVPIAALTLFLVLVGLGKLGKGFRGRIRKLSIVDVAGGETRATGTTFHAFYVSDPNAIELAAQRPIDTVHMVEPFVENAPIDLERNGVAVRSVRAHPWQTVVIAEESVREVPGGVVLEGDGGRLSLTNKTPWTLRHVILHPETTLTAPAKSRWFAEVKPGQTVMARDGTAVERRVRPAPVGWAGGPEESPLKGDKPAEQVADALEAVVSNWSSSAYPAGPLPVGVPFATAFVELPGGKEAGFGVEKDVVLVRVIGLGGGKGKGDLEQPEKKPGKESDL